MLRPSSAAVTAVGLAVCATVWSCDPTSRAVDGPGDPSSPPTLAARLPGVPEPTIDWQPEIYVARFVDAGPTIDGRLEDREWERAEWTADFLDIRGEAAPAPRHATRARMLWDDEYLYIGAAMVEPHVWATLTERDAVIYHDNDFEVFLDPNADTHLYYELEINALGTVWDLLLARPYRDGGPAIDAWDIRGLQTAVAVDGTLNDPTDVDVGWSVEIAIPCDVLAEAAGRPVPPEPGDRWRVNFSRVQWRVRPEEGSYVKMTDPNTGEALDEDNWVWSPQGLIAMHYPDMWGVVEFVGSDHPDGSGGQLTEAERALWALRQVYYRQRERAAADGAWAAGAADLGLDSSPAPGLPWPPSISTTPSGFEATLRLTDGRVAHIREDGLAWLSD
jgi:hypothetical protein